LYPTGQIAWDIVSAPDEVQPGWGKSLRQLYNEMPPPSPDSEIELEGNLPSTWMVRTPHGPVLLEFTSYTPAGNNFQLSLRYMLLPPPGGIQQQALFGPVIERTLSLNVD